MKGLLILSGIAILLSLGSCKDKKGLFGKSGEKDAKIAALAQENQTLKKELEGIDNQHLTEITNIRSDYEQKLAELQQKIEAGTIAEYKVYYVVVGSFKNKKYAEEYAQKVKEMGQEGKIVPGPNDFHLVTAGTFQTLKSSLEPMRQAREKISHEAWVYFRN
jgi:cell division protein FtsN